MPTERLSMRRIRDLLRLKYAQGLSERAIALSLGLGKGTVGGYLARARQAGLFWPLPTDLDDDSLELLLFPSPTMASRLDRPMPDWAVMDRELRRPGVTRALLWEEYRAQAPDGFGYAWFCEHFDAWKGRVRPTMRQTHVGGEKVFVDFAGDTIDVIDPTTGEARSMKLFVAAMGASNYTYAEAVTSPAPARLIPGGMPTEATVAHVLVSKYADHLPLYRQAQIYSRQGVDLDRSTLADWVGRAAFELRPVHDALMANLKRSAKLFMDETRAPVLDPGARKTKTGYFWALARDDRPWGGTAPPGVVFTYAPGRGGQHADRILQGFSGILQVDGYAGYNRLIAPGRIGSGIQLAHCWAHARRKLIEITRTGPAPIAEQGVALIRELYAIEAEIRGNDPATRLAVRLERSAPILARIDDWLAHHRARASAKSPLGGALAYIAKYRDGLGRFLTDGRIEIDNNTVERTIRPIALNRKNALFAGHDAGAENWAVIASLIETCKMNSLDPHAWLAATLVAILKGHKQRQIEDLLPWN